MMHPCRGTWFALVKGGRADAVPATQLGGRTTRFSLLEDGDDLAV
jgi:hypothetical protein